MGLRHRGAGGLTSGATGPAFGTGLQHLLQPAPLFFRKQVRICSERGSKGSEIGADGCVKREAQRSTGRLIIPIGEGEVERSLPPRAQATGKSKDRKGNRQREVNAPWVSAWPSHRTSRRPRASALSWLAVGLVSDDCEESSPVALGAPSKFDPPPISSIVLSAVLHYFIVSSDSILWVRVLWTIA